MLQRMSSINACVNAIVKKEGRIDILISNAGMHASATIEETDEMLFDQVMQLNFQRCFFSY